MDLAKFGERLRLRRHWLGLLLSDITKTTGIAESHLSRIENGKTAPTISMLERLAAGYKVSMQTLIQWMGVEIEPKLPARALHVLALLGDASVEEIHMFGSMLAMMRRVYDGGVNNEEE